jgi:hypothetical protein
MPSTFDFCLPTKATTVPSGPNWLHEVKYDGYRIRLERDGNAYGSPRAEATGSADTRGSWNPR